MQSYYTRLDWQESKNDVTIDCSLDVAVHPAKSKVILLTAPGVDGTVDGYENKYVRIAENIQEQHGAAVIRIANPFITSYHWESNIRQSLAYIRANAESITGGNEYEIRVMAHSAGAAIVARTAHEYATISRLLLINTATKLGLDDICDGLAKSKGSDVTILYGSNDPSVSDFDNLIAAVKSDRMRGVILEGVDHNFSGPSLDTFIDAPNIFLFS